jgi:anti-sigma factor RsiW
VTAVPELEVVCRELVELVTSYLDGALDPEVAAALERHLAECDACTEYLAQVAATTAATGRLPAPGLSERATAEILAAFRDINPV